jgi:hypothetical protein
MWQREITNNRQVQIVPFHWAHPYAMDLREFDKRAFDNIPNYQDMLKAFQAEGGAMYRIMARQDHRLPWVQ